MIYLKKGQTLFDNPGMVVYDPTGYYDDGTSVICAPVFMPEEPACRYEAKYIAYGGIVYSISNEEELLKQILELDPQSLFGKDSKQVAVDKVTDGIVTQGTSEVGEESVTVKEEKEEERAPEQTTEEPVAVPPTDILSDNTSTTTPVVDLPPTVTPPEELIPQETSTTTPADETSSTEVLIETSPSNVPPSDNPTAPSDIITPVETIIESVNSLTQ